LVLTKILSSLTGRHSKAEGNVLPILVCTHHKTGTVWMLRIFDGIQRADGTPYELINLHSPKPDQNIEARTPIFFDPRGDYTLAASLAEDYRGVHVIRDPRDVVISGAYYHQSSSESWLHVKRDDCDGRTYQEAINSGDYGDPFVFEMQRVGGYTIRNMVDWNYADTRILTVKYEDLIQDTNLSVFEQVFRFLNLDEKMLELALEHTRTVSLQFGKDRARTQHVRSGVPSQWRTEFTRKHGEQFVSLFGTLLVDLGYEKDNSWVQCLSE
tara:strand:- start:640 stop:1446 length:807 start_codon:yes stop_codon:yes gene_type:complete